ncbi:non-ribosomal peptide synthetase [Nocardioides hwasunensis]|uniref:Amino acid adenylation domain-containing protein n=1 Tax=Nocardioides hwasunensis TaxID=397258 RepID=A0ABR8MHH7_9ACTN|nr:non-ribosomal peptide synthetase [Nocardioides hwasunensis]MBD3915428.1 amino acid adenylation domain-containing protein [Nocardioides hwasunensis]
MSAPGDPGAVRLELTAAQRGLWYAQQLDPDNVVLNIAHYLDVPGPIDPVAYRRAWDMTVDEIDALHATFGEDAEGPFQLVADSVEWELQEIDLTGDDDPEGAAREWMDADLRSPVDLATPPLMTVALLRVAEDRTFCYQRIHHLVLDGYGATLGMLRVNVVYNALLNGVEPDEPFTGPLAELVADDRDYRASDRAEDSEFWSALLSDLPSPTLLADPPRGLPDRLTRRTRDVPSEVTEALSAAAKAMKVSRSSLLIAAFAAYLHRFTGERDVVLGLPVTGRRSKVSKAVPGMVSNIVPLRLDIRPDTPITELAAQVSKRVRALLKHQRYRPEDIRADLGLGRDARLVGPTINILPIEGTLDFGGHAGTLHNLSVGPVDDMSVVVSRAPDGQGLRIDVDVNPDLYDTTELENHLERFLVTLEAVARDHDSTVGAIRVASDVDRDIIDSATHGTSVDVLHRTVLDFFESQVRRTPDATALVATDSTATFNELDRRANRLARELMAHGAGPGAAVAVALPRRSQFAISLAAAHKSGAVVMPVDPDYPAERIAQMLAAVDPRVVVTDLSVADQLPEIPEGATLLVLDDPDVVADVLGRSNAPVTDEDRGAHISADDPAYVVYTSGSTGRPKGIVVQHRSLVNLFASHSSEMFAPARAAVGGRPLRVAHVTPVSFDAGWDPILWLIGGHELHLVDERTMADPEALVDFLVTHEIDFVETTPTYMEQLVASGLLGSAGDSIRVVALGGEAVGHELWDVLASREDLLAYNLFGPAESTVDVVTTRIEPHDSPVIGRPVANTRAYVLDPGLQMKPVGAAGELYLAGAGLARSYLDQPGLTAERFVADPFGGPGDRMYRTGDVARWRADGVLEFVERVDDQVKVRGFRVELGEIEARLGERDDVSAAAVIVRESDGVQQLVAYVAGDPETLTPADLRETVAAAVPAYMVPALYVVLPEMPLTSNGKLDRNALPSPTGEETTAGAGREPQTPQEQLLAGLFAETLGLPRVGVDDDFFDLGGHSLLATRLVSRIRSAAGAELPIRALFDHPTVAGLAGELAGAAESRADLRPMARPDGLPLSFAQRRLWFLNRMEPASAAYNIPAVLRLTGEIDTDALERAVHDVVARHETLRTTFPEVDGEPRQVIAVADEVDLTMTIDDLTDAPAEGPGSLADVLRRETGRGFELTSELPLRVRLLRVGENEHVLSMVVHHIAGDGWSLGPLATDLAVAYGTQVTDGIPPDWSPLPVQYADYTLWQRELLGDEDDPDSEIRRQLDHWTGRLSGLPTEIDLPRDRARPRERVEGDAAEPAADARVEIELDPDLRDALVDVARAHDVSLFMVVEAALAALLGRLGAGDDVAIGVPVAGRTDEALDSLVGFFVNTLVLRNDLSGDPSFDELVERVKSTALDAYAHQDVPFERVVEEIAPERSLTRHPLFQVMLAFQNNAAAELALPGLDVTVDAAAGPAGAKFDLSVDLGEVERADGRTTIAGAVDYDPALFDAVTVRDLVARLQRLLAAVVTDPGARIGDAALLDDAERRDVLEATDRRELARRGTVVEAFGATVAARTDDVALRAGEERLTFAELDDRSARLAALLLDGGYTGQRIGVALPRGADLVVALLAVLRAGAVYLPIDLEYPRTRIDHIVTDAAPSTILTDRASTDRLPDGTPTLLLDDDATRRLLDGATDLSLPVPAPEDPAYLTYTSGSTGRPKGVLVDHGALGNLHAHQRQQLHEPTAARLDRRVRMAHTTAVSFDAAWDPILWLVSGHELHLVDDDTRRDPEALVALVREAGIDALETTPSYVQALLAEGLGDTGLSLVLLGGEAVGGSLWSELRAHPTIRSVNLYGPTEACVDTVVADLADHETPVLGLPVDGVAAQVLDAALRPVPAGVPGELYLSGVALARGYAGRPGQTAERFVADPYGAPGTRMYRTGDLARRTRDGVLEFIGRVDDQVKVRGFRVELGEIESVLAEQTDVAAAAVAVHTDASGAGRLAAWLVPTPGADVDLDAVRDGAALALPDYMVPVAWATLEALPLTPNGKLDRDALPSADVAASATGREARTDAERILARIYGEVLGLDGPAPVDAGFFDLGGHSLLATRLVSRIRSELDIELGVRALFESPSVEQLATRLPEAGSARRALTAAERPALMPLSWAQHRLWFLNRLEDSSAAYHIPLAVRLRGDLDDEALEAALRDVVSRHEVLRTTLPETDGEPHQQVHDDVDLVLERLTVTEADLADALRRRAEKPFDLALDRPLRASLLTLSSEDHVLLLVVHHVAADGWSLGPLGRDLAEAYDARRGGSVSQREPLAIQYADHALWQREVLGEADDETSELATQLGWWSEQLAGLPAELGLPTDRPRPVAGSNEGGEVRFALDADLHQRLVDFARHHDASPFMLLHATLAALLTRQGGGQDVPLGTPVAGRDDEALDELVGFFVNTLVLRTDTAGDPTLPELLDRVRRTDLDAFAHADLPFERLVEALAPERSLSRHPLFQVMLTADATTSGDLGLTGLDSEVLPVVAGSAKFDLSFSVAEHHHDGAPSGIGAVLEYAVDLYDEQSARALADRWVRLLDRWLAAPSTPLTAVPLLTDAERAAVLPDTGEVVEAAKDSARSTETTVLDTWARTVETHPDEVALVAAGEDGTETLTYAEVAELADRLAGLLARRGIGRGDVVGLAVPRSVGSIIGLLGILRSGATYLPIDPAQPAGRVEAITRAASPAVVLDADDLDSLLTGTDAVPELPQTTVLPSGPRPGDAAYVLFTSGSTGEPKGVVVEHRSLAALLAHHREALFGPAAEAAGRRLRVAHTTAVTFDASWDPVLWLLAGHELHLVGDDTRVDPEALVALVTERGIDVLETTPSYVAELLRLGLPDLAVTALGGEAVGDDLWRDLTARPGRAVNLYGPTESTVDAVVADLSATEHPVIGSPVAGTRALVLDDRLAPVAPGVHGELYLAGDGLARSYLDQAGQTAERFVADPYGPPGSRMYRTGDRARWTADGALDFVGRVDEQVKVRGFRVEPGEIDAVLAAVDGVARAATVAVTDGSGAAALASYLVPEADIDLDVDVVRTAAAARLPDYMLPTAMAVLDELPLTAHGKLDRRALPEPETVGAGGGTPPRTPRERVLAALFAEVLGTDEVGIDDSFFALGGHSLLATRLVSRIRSATGEELAVRALFETPTVAGLAARLDGETPEDSGLDRLLTLRANGEQTPLVAIHPISGLAWPYAGLVPYVADRPLLGLQAPGLTADEPVPDDVEELVDGYVAALRRVRPHGPYALLGWSLGGVLAHRVAARLLDEGEEVEHLVLLDSYPHAVPVPVDPRDTAAAAQAYREVQGDSADALLDVLDADATARLARGVAAVGDALRSAGEPPRIDVPTTIVVAAPGPDGPALAEQWTPYLGSRPTEHPVAHAHFDLFDAEALADVGPVIDATLRGAHR